MGGSEPAEELVKMLPQYGVQADFFHDEYPQHRVRITKPFYMGKYEVTNGQFGHSSKTQTTKRKRNKRKTAAAATAVGVQSGGAKIRGAQSEIQLAKPRLSHADQSAGGQRDLG